MFSWAPLLVMGPGTVYRLYPPLDGTAAKRFKSLKETKSTDRTASSLQSVSSRKTAGSRGFCCTAYCGVSV